MLRNFLLETGAISEIKVTATGFEPTTTQFKNEHPTTKQIINLMVGGSNPVETLK